jgi:hypothetical protein
LISLTKIKDIIHQVLRIIMEEREFLYHLFIIKDLIKYPHVRLILLHTHYTDSQQKIIDFISRESKHIIGQVERNPPIPEASHEIERLILATSEPNIKKDRLCYVIVGRQKDSPAHFKP